jgi:hypothetical protein
MEQALYSKLPCGGNLWTYTTEYHSKHLQKPYDCPTIENPILKNSNADKEISDNRNKTKDDYKNRKQTLMRYIICQIDPMASLYTPTRFKQAENIFRENIVDIVSKGSIHKWLGPKKSRTLLAWITRNNHGVPDEMGKIITAFLSWFLDKKLQYIPEHTNFIAESTEEGITYVTYSNKMFVMQ